MSVFIGSIPNTEKDDIVLAREILEGKIAKKGWADILEEKFEKTFNLKPFLFNRGRDSLYFFLKLLNLKKEDEVILQAFTCVAVVSPILWVDAKPVYVDIQKSSFNMKVDSLRKKINENTRVVIVQHTFGNIVDVKKIKNIIDNENNKRESSRKIYLIEDCAHVFTTDLENFSIGKYSDMHFFSFAQDKSISSTQGALVHITNSSLLEKANREYHKISFPNDKDAIFNARYIILWDRIKRNYFKTLIPFSNISLGRILLILYRKLGLIKKQAGRNTINNPRVEKMSSIQASLLLNQLNKVSRFNNHRKDIANIYDKVLNKEFRFQSDSPFLLRYPILVLNGNELRKKLLDEKIISGNWYRTPVHPLDYNVEKLKDVRYKIGSCPNGEILGKSIFNLPTNIEVSKDDAKLIADIVNKFAKPINI